MEDRAAQAHPAAGATLASTFVFGAPPDCATNKFCAWGLKSTYGIVFKEIKSLDFGGPETVAALKSGAVQVGELFSTSVYDPDFQVLVDDKHLEAADNIAPGRSGRTSPPPDVTTLLNGVSAKLTTDGMLALNKQVDIDHQDVADVAKTFLNEQGLLELADHHREGEDAHGRRVRERSARASWSRRCTRRSWRTPATRSSAS